MHCYYSPLPTLLVIFARVEVMNICEANAGVKAAT